MGNTTGVPLLIGTNRYEYKAYMRYYGAFIRRLLVFPSGDYSWNDAFRVFDPGDLTLDDVLPTADDKDLYETIAGLWSRQWRARGADQPASAVKAENDENPVYSYVFQWGGGGDPEKGGLSGRLSTLATLRRLLSSSVGTTTSLDGVSQRPIGPVARRCKGAMMDYLGSFVWTGDPNLTGFISTGVAPVVQRGWRTESDCIRC